MLTTTIAIMAPEDQRALLFKEAQDLTRFAGQRVAGVALADDIVAIGQAVTDGQSLRLTARVHAVSGLSWMVERSAPQTPLPSHGVVSMRMALQAYARRYYFTRPKKRLLLDFNEQHGHSPRLTDGPVPH